MKHLLVAAMFAVQLSFGQIENKDTMRTVNPDLEELLEHVTDEDGESLEADVLVHLLESPLDVNNAAKAELEAIPGMSRMFAEKIVSARKIKRFRSIAELLEVGGVTIEEYDRVRPYLTVAPAAYGRSRLRIRSRIQRDIPPAEVSTPVGSPVKMYSRVLLDTRQPEDDGTRVESGLLIEKDPGERYADVFTAGFMSVNAPRAGGSLLIGDYSIESNRGLMFSRSLGMSKGGDVIAVGKPRETRLEPYRSTNENRFFRGIAIQQEVGRYRLIGFFSSRWLNGSKNREGILTSLDTDGLFRTSSELKTLHVIREIVAGGMISMTPAKGLQLGFKVSTTRLDAPVALSRFKSFEGKGTEVMAADVTWRGELTAISGEVARDRDGSVSSSLAVYCEPAKTIKLVASARMYPRSFKSLHGVPLSESGLPEGERGLYLGSILNPASWLNVSLMYDVYELSNRFAFPALGHDFFTRLKFRPDRRWEISFNIKTHHRPAMIERKEHGLSHQEIGSVVQRRYRLSALFVPSEVLRWQARVECSAVESNDHGVLVFQELRWRCLPVVRLSFRVSVFKTDSYASRLYAYEHDVPGAFSNVPVWGSGTRVYIVGEIDAIRGGIISFKFSRLFRQTQVPGNSDDPPKDRVTIQFDAEM